MDIHGGPRETQTLFDAAITVLGIENIEIRKVYTCNVGSKEVLDVTDQFRIFKFVSGIDDFINHGSSYEIKNYVEKCCDDNKHNREELVKAIQKISDAVLLCKVSGFETALDNLKTSIGNGNENDYMLKMLVDIIKSDYGKLLEKDRSLYDEIKWAWKKDLYQQALTIIEAKTPRYIFLNFLDIDTFSCEDEFEKYIDKEEFIEIFKKNYDEEFEVLLFNTFYKPVSVSDGVLSYHIYRNKYHKYNVKIDVKKDFGEKEFNEFLQQWRYIKSKIRNPIAHSSNVDLEKVVKERSVQYDSKEIVVSEKIAEYLNSIKKLEGEEVEVFKSSEIQVDAYVLDILKKAGANGVSLARMGNYLKEFGFEYRLHGFNKLKEYIDSIYEVTIGDNDVVKLKKYLPEQEHGNNVQSKGNGNNANRSSGFNKKSNQNQYNSESCGTVVGDLFSGIEI